jgi:lauroyl/myristoyl acyltransferase
MLMDAPPVSHDLAPRRYLRALVAVARSARAGEYAIVYLSSGTFFRTDRLGALAVRAMVNGSSDIEVMELLDRIEAGAGGRARQLIDVLDLWGAMSRTPPSLDNRRWRTRRLAVRTIGLGLSVLGPLVDLAPTAVLTGIFGSVTSTAMTHYAWRSARVPIINNMRASGYAGQDEAALLDLSRRSTGAASGNYVFMFLSTVLSPERLGRVVDRLFDRDSADALGARLQETGPTIGVFLHGPLCVAVPNALRARGHQVVRVLVPWTHGNNVSERSGPLRDFFGEPSETGVAITDPLALGALLRHLKGGRSIYIALDEPARGRKPAADVQLLGRWVPRIDGPAWLAVRSGRPLALWTTHSSPSGIVVSASPLLHPDPSLPVEQRVATLSERLYACAEDAIREHPEAWGRGWALWGHRPADRPRRLTTGATSAPSNV